MTIITKILDIVKDKMIVVKQTETENICLVGPVNLPVKQGDFSATFQWYSWLKVDAHLSKEEMIDSLATANLAFEQQSSVLVYGDFANEEDALIRMHSICHTGDIFGSQRCDCGYQLHQSIKMITEHGCGAIFYLADHEGRGIGLFPKAIAYLLQEEGLDTVEANHALGFPDDARSYEDAITVLGALRTKSVTLITNNPKKLSALQAHGLAVEGHVPLWGGLTETNRFYLETKVEKSGHMREEQ